VFFPQLYFPEERTFITEREEEDDETPQNENEENPQIQEEEEDMEKNTIANVNKGDTTVNKVM
jgi:hypothetical protein